MSVPTDKTRNKGDEDEERIDRDLIRQIRSGDDHAFCKFYEKHVVAMVRYSHSILGDAGLAEDIVQDVFMAIWERRSEWFPAESVVSYIYRAVRNRTIDIARHSKVRDRALERGIFEPHLFVAATSTADSDLVINEQSTRIAQAIAKLPEKRRIALIMRAVQSAEYSEIAQVLGITEQATRILVTRAREAIRQDIKDGE